MKHALEDCKKQSVRCVSFWTTSYDLEKYYCSLGFQATRRTKLGEVRYELRLKPHPLKVLAKELVDQTQEWLQHLKNK